MVIVQCYPSLFLSIAPFYPALANITAVIVVEFCLHCVSLCTHSQLEPFLFIHCECVLCCILFCFSHCLKMSSYGVCPYDCCLTDPRGCCLGCDRCSPYVLAVSCDKSTCLCYIHCTRSVVVVMVSFFLLLCHGSIVHHLLTKLLQ